MLLTTDSLLELKIFFNTQLEATLMSMRSNDSDRLRRNKINGFLIILQDRLFEMKPKLMCNGCGKADVSEENSESNGQPVLKERPNTNFTIPAAENPNIHIET